MSDWQNKLFIDGNWIETAETIDIINPATLEKIGYAPIASEMQIKEAVNAADQALPRWKALTANQRAELLWRWHYLIDEHKEIIAKTMTTEQGKPYLEALGEVQYANSFVSWYAEEGKRIYGDTVPATVQHKRIMAIKQPVGVVAAITPWNFPAAMITRKISPALAAGCTVVVKPSELTPLTAYLLAKLAQQAGIPNGVLNVITGDAQQIGELWMSDTRIRKLSFTGSTKVGKLLMAGAAETVKRISLELGGHAPFIVAEHANIELAVEQFIQAKFRNAGQTCVCPNRLYVHTSVKDAFIDRLKQEFSQLKVGNGMDKDVTIGPLINEQAVLKVKKHISDAVNEGATSFMLEQPLPSEGHFVSPTILVNVKEHMLCMREETFGPIAPILTFDSTLEVIQRANNTNYGLAAYVFSEKISEAIKICEALEYGIVGLNDGAPSVAQAPFGGMKQSGLGREGGYWGLEEFLETKYISINIGQ